jgi:hypothetical protein
MTSANTFFHAWLVAMLILLVFTGAVWLAQWFLKRCWPHVWELIDPATPAAGLPCRECGRETELHGDITACPNCGECW